MRPDDALVVATAATGAASLYTGFAIESMGWGIVFLIIGAVLIGTAIVARAEQRR